MHIPQKFAVKEIEKHIELIEQNPLGIVITSVDEDIEANYIPFVLKRSEQDNDNFYLLAHLAATNKQVGQLETAESCLIIFTGRDAYITPNWYPSKKETHKEVPTWDFAGVHVKGKPTIFRDENFKVRALDALTTQQESKRCVKEEEKWKLSDAPENYLKLKMKAIVGLKVEVTSTEGKWKFEQGRKDEDIEGVIDGLRAENVKDGAEVAQIIKKCNFA